MVEVEEVETAGSHRARADPMVAVLQSDLQRSNYYFGHRVISSLFCKHHGTTFKSCMWGMISKKQECCCLPIHVCMYCDQLMEISILEECEKQCVVVITYIDK